jgi:hypothetical protein
LAQDFIKQSLQADFLETSCGRLEMRIGIHSGENKTNNSTQDCLRNAFEVSFGFFPEQVLLQHVWSGI